MEDCKVLLDQAKKMRAKLKSTKYKMKNCPYENDVKKKLLVDINVMVHTLVQQELSKWCNKAKKEKM